MTEQEQNVRFLVSLAAIRVPDDRLAAIAMGLQANSALAQLLVRLDFGETEPAARFSPPIDP